MAGRGAPPQGGIHGGDALIALGLAMADTLPLYRLHHTLLPPSRGPTRLLFFWTVGVAVLGGLGLDTLLARIRAGGRLARRIAWYPALTAVVLIGVALAWSWRNGLLGEQGFIGMDSASSPDGVLGTPGWLVAVQLGILASLGALAAGRRGRRCHADFDCHGRVGFRRAAG